MVIKYKPDLVSECYNCLFILSSVNPDGTSGNDIIAQTFTVNFPSGTTEQVQMIPIIQDNEDEDNEKFEVTLVEESGKILGEPSSDTLIIVCELCHSAIC